MQRVGVNSVYAFLSAAALWPVVEVYKQGDLAAIIALGGVLGGASGNLLANCQYSPDIGSPILRLRS